MFFFLEVLVGSSTLKKAKTIVFTCLILSVFLANLAAPVVFSEPTINPPKFGIFYYVWYNETAQPWEPSVTVDMPLLGLYDSSNPEVISQHLTWIEDLGVDFVIISWWGNYDNYGLFTDYAAKQVFETAKNIESNLKFAIMVEPFPLESDSYNYQEIYNHTYETFVIPYSSLYYNDTNGNPLICFYNDPEPFPSLTDNGVIPLDERFSIIIVGQEPYTQWIYTDLASPGIYRENQISVTPRYDESLLPDRLGKLRVDPDLTQGVFDKEWETAIKLWQEGKIDTILISTWNEYFERTEIEPHFDATAENKNPYLLYQQTRDYINKFNEPFILPAPSEPPEPSSSLPQSTSTPNPSPVPLTPTTEVIPEYSDALIVTFILFATVTICCIRLKKSKKL